MLDQAWAERLGAQRTGGLYRIGRRELAERLADLNNAQPLAGHLRFVIRELTANASHTHDMNAAGGHVNVPDPCIRYWGWR